MELEGPAMQPVEQQLAHTQQQLQQAQAQLAAVHQSNSELANAVGALQQQFASLLPTLHASAAHAPAPIKIIKPVPPVPFHGHDDKQHQIEPWLFSLNSYFRALQINDDQQRISYATCLLQGHAAQWFRLQCLRTSDSQPYRTWAEMEAALEKQFKPVNLEKRARDRLAELRQQTSVRRYLEQFTTLCLEIPDLHPTEQFHRFIHGLKPHVRRELELQDPKTFDEAA